MFLIIDAIVVLIVVFAIIKGIKKGFVGGSLDVFGYFIVIGITLCGTVTLCILCGKLGLIEKLTSLLSCSFGTDGSFLSKIGLTSEKIAGVLAFAVVVSGCFILSFLPSKRAFKSIRNTLTGCVKRIGIIRFVDSFIGATINVAFAAVFVLGAFRTVRSFSDTKYLSEVDDCICECPISSVIYQNNPLDLLFNEKQLF